MAQPQAYNRETDFTERDGDDTNHAGINTELDAAALSINELRDNLALIQRDDGALKNGIVTAESLSDSAFNAVLGEVATATAAASASADRSTLFATQAEADRIAAQTAAAAAQSSQTAAATSATAAASSQTAAANSATSAATSASTATTKANEASTSATNAATSATAAAGSATTASTQATNAANSATASATSATNSANSASTATTQAGIATTQASNAAASAAAAAATLDDFDDRYLGSKTVDPTTDNDGNALLTGALYFNSVAGEMRVWAGTFWKATGSSVGGTINTAKYTATAGQTTFAIVYDIGFVHVYLNGVKLESGVEFTANNGTSVVLATGAIAGDVVDMIAFGIFSVANTYTKAELNAPTGSSLVGFQQSGAGSVPRTVDAELKDRVSVKQFGAVGDGVTDDRAAIQAALNASTKVYFPTPAVSYYMADSVSPQNNTTIYGDGASSHIQLKDGSVNGFYLNGVSGVIIRDLKISTKLQTNATAYKCGILMANECRNCLVENVSMFNMGHWGVAIYSSSNCVVRGCRFSTWFGAIQDSAQITIQKTSNNNLIEGNYCIAASEHGILIQDPYANDTPTGNSIINNYVANATYAGIIVYVTTAYDTQTLISGNRVFDIAGTALSGQSGHGIYIQSAGGSIVTNNTISNCCISTTSFETQVVAAIGVATGDTTGYPTGTINEVIVTNNHIIAQRGPGISVQTCGVPVLVEGNHILSIGTASVRGEAIYSVNADGLQVKNNTIKHANTNYNAIQITASAKALNGIAVVGNRIRGATYGMMIQAVGVGGSISNAVVTGNIISGLSNIGLYLHNLTGVLVSNNNVASSGPVYYHSSCTRGKLTANRFYSNYGSYSIIFTGAASANAGTVADESNDFAGTIENDAGTGAIISRYASSAPGASGLHAVGDRVIQSVPVVGNPKGWRCTVAGNPGTWVSEGNL